VTYILVGDQSSSLFKGNLGGLLDIGLSVPNGSGQNGNQVGHSLTHLSRSRVDQLLQDLERSMLDLPFTSSLDLFK
jgi:hypothetical protein